MNKYLRDFSDMNILKCFLTALSADIRSVILFWNYSPKHNTTGSIAEEAYKYLAEFAGTEAGKVPQIKVVLMQHYQIIKGNYVKSNPKADVNSVMPDTPFQ